MADEPTTTSGGGEELEAMAQVTAPRPGEIQGEGEHVPAVRQELAPAMGKTVGRGITWMVVSNVLTKGASFITFALVATILDPRDIGVWTMAFSFAAFAQFLRDGGVISLLIQRGSKEYEELAGPVFWISLVINTLVAGLLAGLAPFAAGPNWYNEPELKKLLWVMAAVMPFQSAAGVLWGKLQADLRFGVLSRLAVGSAIIRYGGTGIGVWMGLGPMAFVLPMPFATVFDFLGYYWFVRDKPWMRAPKFEKWWTLINEGKWLVFVTFAFAVVNQGPYFLLGKLITTEQLGVFSFAYQLVGQIDQMLAATTAFVLFPALARLNQERDRQKAATLRAASVMTVLASLASFGLLVVVEPLEHLIWGQKWAAAVVPAQITAVAFAWRVLLWVPAPALQAMGLFRFSAMLALIAGLLLMASGAIGAKLGGGDPKEIAVWMAGCNGVGFLAMSLWGMKRVGVGPWAVLKGTVPSWLCCGLAAVAAMGVYKLTHPLITANLHDRGAAALDILVTGTVFTGLAFVLLKLFVPGVLKELGAMVPARLGFVKRYL